MIKADMRWNEEEQCTDVKVSAAGKTLNLGKEFIEFMVTFSKHLDESAPGFGPFCIDEARKILSGDGGDKAPAPVTPIKPVN